MENNANTFKGLVHISPGKPMALVPTEDISKLKLKPEQQELHNAIGKSMRAYIDTIKELLDGKYAHLKEYAPRHLRDSTNILAVCCQDGIIVRYDINPAHQEPKPSVAVGYAKETISQLTPVISESVVYCHPDKNFKSLIPEKGPEIKLTKGDIRTGREVPIFHARLGFDIVIPPISDSLPKPPSKPYCLISVRNELEIGLTGKLLPTEHSTKKERTFFIRYKLRLPLGWECIEVFLYPELTQWKPEYAKIWAENDLLASVVAVQYRDRQLNNLDPNAAARAEIAKLLYEYRKLLDSEPSGEEPLQLFLTEHPELLCSTYIKVKPKLEIGPYITDFVFQEASRDYLLVELEKSTDSLFIKNGDTSSKLNHARNQISDWRRYIEDNLHTVQRELDLTDISSNPRGLVVIGRSGSLNADNKRKLATLLNESPNTKIMTYDDVFDNAKAVVENLLGPLWLESGKTEVYYLPEQ